MPLLTYYRGALIAISAALAGCAGTAPVKDATILSVPKAKTGKMAPRATATKETEVQPALELDAAIRQAQTERKLGDLTGATKTLSQLVLVAPDDPRVLGEYGKTLVALGRSDDALAFLERAIQLQPSDWSLFSAQGVAFDQKSEYKQAQISYERALSLRPGEPTVLSNDALSHMQTGDLEGAEVLLREAAKAGGDYPRIKSNLALVESLKASRSAANTVRAKTVVAAPAPTAEPLSDPTAAPTVASVPSVPPPAASVPEPATTPEPASAGIVGAPVERAALPDPADQMTVSSLRPTPAEALASDPTVHMQAVPKDEHAGPVVVRKRRVAETHAVVKQNPSPDPKVAADTKPQDPSDSFLRPTMVEAAAPDGSAEK